MSKQVEKIIDETLNSISEKTNIYTTGKVIKINQYIVEISNLSDVSYYDTININDKAMGYVSEILTDRIRVALVEISKQIFVGDIAYSTGKPFKCLFSMSSLGKVIDIFGNDLFNNQKFDNVIELDIENPTIEIKDRSKVCREFLTGIMGIDLLYPIGKGQRQLIVGDKATGKTQICLDAIVNQKNKDVLCLYVALGKTKREVKHIYYDLVKRGAASYTIIIASFNDELPTREFLTPYGALSIAEFFMNKGLDVALFIDDLKKHADIYRQISLAEKKVPGRDAYPSDIFYTHARMLEKGCQHINGGSITILPVVETKSGDISDYITTNIISITDGQIVMSAKNFQLGQKPAIDYGLSVSRLGGSVQDNNMKMVGSKLRRDLLSYLEMRGIYELVDVDDFSANIKKQLIEGKSLLNRLDQYKYSPKTKEEMLSTYKEFMDGGNL